MSPALYEDLDQQIVETETHIADMTAQRWAAPHEYLILQNQVTLMKALRQLLRSIIG